MMFTKEQIEDFTRRAYDTACAHGFHEKELSSEHLLMLVLSEVGEAVEAHRGMKRALYEAFVNWSAEKQAEGQKDKHWVFCFDHSIKGSLEEEMADICIRLFDYMGAFGIRLDEGFFGVTRGYTAASLDGYPFTENAFYLSKMLTSSEGVLSPSALYKILSFVCAWAEVEDVDLVRYIDLKMKYNALRPRKHGKLY